MADESEYNIPSENVDDIQKYLVGGKKKARKSSKKGAKKSSKKRSRKLRRASRKASKKASKKGSKKGSKKASRKTSKRRLSRNKSRSKKRRSLRRIRSAGQIAYMDFLDYIKKALGIEGGVKFKMGSHYKKMAEKDHPDVTGEKIYKFAKEIFDSDNKDTKNKLIEKFKAESANKKRTSKKKPTNYSETTNE